jgi:hypothetical protein
VIEKSVGRGKKPRLPTLSTWAIGRADARPPSGSTVTLRAKPAQGSLPPCIMSPIAYCGRMRSCNQTMITHEFIANCAKSIS